MHKRKKMYILTERLRGDYEGKLAILESSKSLKPLQARREEIIDARIESPLFGEKWTKENIKRMKEGLEIWGKR